MNPKYKVAQLSFVTSETLEFYSDHIVSSRDNWMKKPKG